MPIAQPFEITVTPDDDYRVVIADKVPESFHVRSVGYSSDVYFQQSEFDYLVAFSPGMIVTRELFAKVLSYLFKKNKFESIVIRCTPGDVGFDIHFTLVGFWTFRKVTIKSMSLGKDQYRQYYVLEPGERFDDKKHVLSLQKIQEALQQEGYFTTQLTSTLRYDAQTKSVDVIVGLAKGERFSIGKVELAFTTDGCVSPADVEQVRSKAFKSVLKRLSKSSYNKKNLNKIAKDFKLMLSKQGFVQAAISLDETINSDEHTVDLTFSVELLNKKKFLFNGNESFSDNVLLDQLLLFGRAVWLLPAQILQQEIEQLYKSKGFWNVVIESEETCDHVVFTINEGPRSNIVKVVLTHVTIAQPDQLAKKYFGPLCKSKHVFDAKEIDAAQEALLNFYTQQGFMDAVVSKREFIPCTPGSSDYILSLTLQEGACVYVTQVTIDDQFKEVLTQGPFVAFTTQGLHVPCTMKLIEEQRSWLIEYFQKVGYLGAKIRPEFVREGNAMHLAWKVTTGKTKTIFGKTVILGSTTFPFEYVQRELSYKEGDVWDKDALKQSLTKLRGLEVFDAIHLYPYDESTQDNEKVVVLKLQEDDRYEIRTRAGFAFQQVNKHLHYAGMTYRLGGTFLMKNPLNYGDLFSVDADFALSQRTLSVNYRLPWLWNFPVRTLIQGYSNLFQYPGCIALHKPNIYQVNQDGLLVGLSRQYVYALLGCNLGVEFLKTSIREESHTVSSVLADKVAVAIDFEPHLLNKKIPYAHVEPTFMFNGLDNRLDPTMGYFGLLSCKCMVPLDRLNVNSYFIRFFTEQSFFIPAFGMVFGCHLRCGHIFHRKFRHVAPPERFYLGGANSIRAYERDRCPPLGVVQDEDGRRYLVPRGGKSMMNINLEARFPVYKTLGGVVFQDLGALGGDTWGSIGAQTILAATGFGVRYMTPIGPLRFDIGWKWRRNDPSERWYAWFLTLGNAF